MLTWRDGRWKLRDLGSRNGTSVDDVPLPPGEVRGLAVGARLTLGSVTLTLTDAGPPGPVAVSPEVQVADGQMLCLPSEADPRAVLYSDGDGGWVLERDGEPTVATDAVELDLDGTTWRVLLPPVDRASPPTTWALGSTPAVESVALLLEVSLDEEHVAASVALPAGAAALSARAHHQLTLLLGRARLEDAEAGLPDGEMGWRYADEVGQMLGIDRPQVNQYAFRLRRELADAGVDGAPRAVERRPLTGTLRLGIRDVRITRC